MWYRTGTVTVVNGSTAVVGANTQWLTQAKAGDIFTVDAAAWYEILAVVDDTHLTLQKPYEGGGSSSAAYAVIRNFNSSTAADIASSLSLLMNKYHLTLDEMVAWLTETGNVTLHDALGNSHTVPSVNKIAAMVGAQTTKNIAGEAPIVAVSSEEASAVFINLVGERAANATVVFPNSVGLFGVFNNTTGAYTVTVKTASGAGVMVTQGKRALLYCDGANVLSADNDSASLGTMAAQSADAVQISGGTISGIKDLAIADGGTGASSAEAARVNLGLGNVDNTSDADKPVSVAVAQALSGKAATNHSHTDYALAEHSHSGYAAELHNHDGVYAPASHSHAGDYIAAASPSTSGTLTHSGDIFLSGSGKRITGDFSNATAANRVMFQTSAADQSTQVGAIPKGNGGASYFATHNGSDPANSSRAYLGCTASEALLVSTFSGSGSYLPMSFYVGGSKRLTLDTAGNAQMAGTLSMGTQFSHRNLLINGCFRVWQRGTNGAIPLNAYTYTADRWVCDTTGAPLTWGQGGDATGNPNGSSLVIYGAAGNTGMSIAQRIEASNTGGLLGKQVTLSFKAYAAGSVQVSLILITPNSKDAFPGGTTVQSIGPITVPVGQFTYFTRTFNALPASVANGLEVYFSVSALGSGVAFALDEVQLEEGSTATPFERLPIAAVESVCQRYGRWVPIDIWGQASGTPQAFGHSMPFSPPMRAAPTMGAPSALDPEAIQTNYNVSSVAMYYPTKFGVGVAAISAATGPVQYTGYRSWANAEL